MRLAIWISCNLSIFVYNEYVRRLCVQYKDYYNGKRPHQGIQADTFYNCGLNPQDSGGKIRGNARY